MTTTETKPAPAWKVREDLAQGLAHKEIEKWFKREFIGEVAGLKTPRGSAVYLLKFTFDEGKETEKVYELTNQKGLGSVLEYAFFDLWTAKTEEIKLALELADSVNEMVEEYKAKGNSHKARFIGGGIAIEQAKKKQEEIWRKIETARYVAQ
jgi:hypothetical protein